MREEEEVKSVPGRVASLPTPNPAAQSKADRIEQGEAAIKLEREVYMRVVVFVCVSGGWFLTV